MFTNPLSLLALGAVTFATAQAGVVGDAAAVTACQGFEPGSIKCVSLDPHLYPSSPFTEFRMLSNTD